MRRVCAEVWHARVTDIYSANEVGYLALQCPGRDSYHVQAESCFVEVLDDAGAPCGPGQSGRVVVTPLHNFAMPLIRYELGDYAEVGAACPCGRGLPVLSRVLGRTRNMVVLPNGDRRWPIFGAFHFAEIAPVRQHQLIQRGATQVEVRLVVDRALTDPELARIRGRVVESLGFPFELVFSFPSEIGRSPGGKYEEFRSDMGPVGAALPGS